MSITTRTFLRCLKGRLPNILTVLSLLLCAGIVGRWLLGRSAGPHPTISVEGQSRATDYIFQPGRIMIRSVPGELLDDGVFAVELPRHAPGQPRVKTRPGDWWFFYASETHVSGRSGFEIVVPAWAPLLLTLLLPARWLIARRRRRYRFDRNLCTACGYDLRATRGRCPECGTSVSAW